MVKLWVKLTLQTVLAIIVASVPIMLLWHIQSGPRAEAEKIPHDPLLTINPSASMPPGRLAYLVKALPAGPAQPSAYDLVFRSTGKPLAGNTPLTINQIKPGLDNLFYDFLLSPNGEHLLLKQGMPSDYTSTYLTKLWNVETGQLRDGLQEEIRNPNISWCPDSKHISFIKGGDIYGTQTHNLGPLSLYVYDLNTRKSHFVAQNPLVSHLGWTKQGTLLYTTQPTIAGTSITDRQKRPSIFEVPVQGGVAVKVIDGGSDPVPSPDGRWVIFFGWPTSDQEVSLRKSAKAKGQEFQSQPNLYLFDRRQGKRLLLHTVVPGQPRDNAIWAKDSKLVFTVSNDYKTTRPVMASFGEEPLYPGYGTGHIRVISIPTLKSRDITQVTANDVDARSDPNSQFRLEGVSANNRLLFVLVSRTGNKLPGPPYFDNFLDLKAVDVLSGGIQDVWTTKNADALDWQLLNSP